MLNGSDAVAAILLLEDGRYVMQLRDDKRDIWFPNHWGCFGGAVEQGESPEQALSRELYEEIELSVRKAEFFTRFDFDMSQLGLATYYRIYYLVRATLQEFQQLRLREGQKMRTFNGDQLLDRERVTPYDAFALRLYHDRARIGDGKDR